MSKGKASATSKTIARRDHPLSKPTASVNLSLSPMQVTPDRLRVDPALFADTFLPNNEKGKAWRLSRHQRRVLARAFRRSRRGELRFRLVLWSEPKKSSKTFLAGVLLLWWAFSNAHTEIIVAANDLDQSISRVFETAVALVKHNPALAELVTVRAEELLFKNDTVVTAIASDYRGAAGSRHSLVISTNSGFHLAICTSAGGTYEAGTCTRSTSAEPQAVEQQCEARGGVYLGGQGICLVSAGGA